MDGGGMHASELIEPTLRAARLGRASPSEWPWAALAGAALECMLAWRSGAPKVGHAAYPAHADAPPSGLSLGPLAWASSPTGWLRVSTEAHPEAPCALKSRVPVSESRGR